MCYSLHDEATTGRFGTVHLRKQSIDEAPRAFALKEVGSRTSWPSECRIDGSGRSALVPDSNTPKTQIPKLSPITVSLGICVAPLAVPKADGSMAERLWTVEHERQTKQVPRHQGARHRLRLRGGGGFCSEKTLAYIGTPSYTSSAGEPDVMTHVTSADLIDGEKQTVTMRCSVLLHGKQSATGR